MSHDHPLPSPTVVDVSSLLDQPGATRPVDLDVPLPAGFEIPLTTFGLRVAIEGVLESLVDGVLLRGTVSVDAEQNCALCLVAVDPGRIAAHVAELYSDPALTERPDDVEPGYGITAGTIDVDALVRDALATVTAAAPRCRPDCAGLCPSCGSDRNLTTCECRDDTVDDRWAALAHLKLNH